MGRYVVEMFGIPYSISGKRQVEFELEDEVKLSDIIAALRREIPDLEGEVITTGGNYLMEGFTFNINGRFYDNDRTLILNDSDHIILLTLATVG